MANPEVEFLIIADAVEAVSGKLYMLGGGWNRWTAKTYPSQVRLGLGIGVLVPWDRTNERIDVQVNVEDADGNPVGPQAITASLEVGRPPGVTQGSNQRAVLGINMAFPLPHPGRYLIRASLGGADSVRTVEFDAVLAGP